jgi:uncharacterized phage-associated protein
MKELNFDSKDVLVHIILKCAELGYEFNITKGQKLLYCCYGAVLAFLDARLCKEHPMAWQYGPVFPKTYEAYVKSKLDYSSDVIANSDNPRLKSIVDGAIELFGKYKAYELVNWSHSPVSPWSTVTNHGKILYHDIPDSLIAAYFKKVVAE